MPYGKNSAYLPRGAERMKKDGIDVAYDGLELEI